MKRLVIKSGKPVVRNCLLYEQGQCVWSCLHDEFDPDVLMEFLGDYAVRRYSNETLPTSSVDSLSVEVHDWELIDEDVLLPVAVIDGTYRYPLVFRLSASSDVLTTLSEYLMKAAPEEDSPTQPSDITLGTLVESLDRIDKWYDSHRRSLRSTIWFKNSVGTYNLLRAGCLRIGGEYIADRVLSMITAQRSNATRYDLTAYVDITWLDKVLYEGVPVVVEGDLPEDCVELEFAIDCYINGEHAEFYVYRVQLQGRGVADVCKALLPQSNKREGDII